MGGFPFVTLLRDFSGKVSKNFWSFIKDRFKRARFSGSKAPGQAIFTHRALNFDPTASPDRHQRCRLYLAPTALSYFKAWGIAPGDLGVPLEISAESAFHQAGGESRFQRWPLWFPRILGRCPSLQLECAPLARNTYADAD